MKSILQRLQAATNPVPPASTIRRRLTLSSLPPVVYAVGDIHGCFKELLAAEALIRADAAGPLNGAAAVIYLGDYVDRGPQSRSVIEHLSVRKPGDPLRRVTLCGNHDDTFLRFLRSQATSMPWLDFGGDTTLLSYGIDPNRYLPKGSRDVRALSAALKAAIPPHHIAFLEGLPSCLLAEKHLFVHAGIAPGVALKDQSDKDLLWIREPFLSTGPASDLIVIHGHTRSIDPDFGPGRIGIDTGCYATGRLTVLKIEDGEAKVL